MEATRGARYLARSGCPGWLQRRQASSDATALEYWCFDRITRDPWLNMLVSGDQ